VRRLEAAPHTPLDRVGAAVNRGRGNLARLTWTWMLLAGMAVLMAGCASGPALVDQGFGFDAVADSPGIDVLDYRYGTSLAPGARMPESVRKDHGASGGTSTHGPMVRGETLYVRWRVRATGAEHEETADLRGRLPRDMADHLVYFVVQPEQLQVYLVAPQARAEGEPVVGPAKFRANRVQRIYPDQADGLRSKKGALP
jgi:hypothetical protein